MQWLQVQRLPRHLRRLAPTFRRRRLTPWRTILLAELRRAPGVLSRNRTNPQSQPLRLLGTASRWWRLRLEWLEPHQLARRTRGSAAVPRAARGITRGGGNSGGWPPAAACCACCSSSGFDVALAYDVILTTWTS